MNDVNGKRTTTIVILAVYAVAMAMVEAVAVVYLRELYYPGGFSVASAADLAVIPAHILRVEFWREAATIVMLVAVALVAFSGRRERFLAFLWAFSLWDLGYYLFLYLFLRWPSSLGALDVYFLIPWPWIGPVWFPLLLFGATAVVSFRLLTRCPTK